MKEGAAFSYPPPNQQPGRHFLSKDWENSRINQPDPIDISQTLAHQATAHGCPLTLKRYCAALLSLACLGLGFLWILVDKEKLAWHDHMSATRMVITAKKK